MKRKYLEGMLVGTLVLGLVGAANASLTTIGTATYRGTDFKLIYDDDSPFGPVAWLDYTNSPYNWYAQTAWAASLNSTGVLNIHLYPGVTANWTGGWRLPATADGPYAYGYNGSTTAGYNITSSEMGHLFYAELLNKAPYDTNGNDQLRELQDGPFENLYLWYSWSGTESAYASDPTAYCFSMSVGWQDLAPKDAIGIPNAHAVRPGQVVATPVPAAVWLLGSGIVGLGGVLARRKRAQANKGRGNLAALPF